LDDDIIGDKRVKEIWCVKLEDEDSSNEKVDRLKKPPKVVRMSRMDTQEEGYEVSNSQSQTPCGDAGDLAWLACTSGSETRDMSMTKGSRPSITDNTRLCAGRELFQMIKFVNQKIHS
jgi:hypothetical protein